MGKTAIEDFFDDCKGGMSRFVRKAIEDDGVDVNIRDKHGDTPLHMASIAGNYHTARVLIEHNADVHARDCRDGRTPLHEACLWGSISVVRLLIESGADINAQDDYEATALHYACWGGHIDITRLLLDAGLDIMARRRMDGTKELWCPSYIFPLDYACDDGSAKIVQLLLEAGAKPGPDTVKIAIQLPPTDPAREEILDLFRQYAPEAVMETYCTAPAT